MVTSMSHRTQITLTDEQYERLQSESQRSGLSMAELIRRAVDGTYKRELSVEEKLAALRASAGAWADRDDIVDGKTYVEEIRRGFRSDRREESA